MTSERVRVADYYDRSIAIDGMVNVRGWLGLARLREELIKHLPAPPALIADSGSGSGVQSAWLQARGYAIAASDISSAQTRSAAQTMGKQHGTLGSCVVADALHQPYRDNTFDAFMALGPIYHMLRKQDRVTALAEAGRTSKANATIIVEGLNPISTVLNAAIRPELDQNALIETANQIIDTGHETKGLNAPAMFENAFYHNYKELEEEVEAAGLRVVESLALQGPLWLNEAARSPTSRNAARVALQVARRFSREAWALATTFQFLVIAKNP